MDSLTRRLAAEKKGQPGVYHLDALPGLELRVGGTKPDGTPKQIQSVCPPTPGTDGRPRVWNGVATIATASEAFYANLERLAGEMDRGGADRSRAVG